MSFMVSTAVDKITEFHKALYAKVREASGEELALPSKPDQPYVPGLLRRWPGSDTARLRQNLIKEEASELMTALEEEDLEAVAKELADVLYVSLAVAVLYNIPIDAVFNRVHKNNMLKLENGTIREADGKLLKPKDHPKTVLKDLFQ